MKESSQLWVGASRLVPIAAAIGVLLGMLIGAWNDDQIGWSLLRMACLGLAFAWAARVVTRNLLRAWMETRLKEMEEKKKQADKEKPKTQ